MRIFYLTAGLVLLALLLVSGCVSDTTADITDNAGAESAGNVVDGNEAVLKESELTPAEPEVIPEEQEETPESVLPEGSVIIVGDIVIENNLYHSKEIMRFNVTVSSDTYLESATLNAAGIAGKMNINKDVNVSEGNNMFEFEFKLPSCNSCGGIRAGTHSIDARLYYMAELVAENSTSVEIRQ